MINFDNIENSLRHEIADDNGDGSCDLTNTALLELINRLRQSEKDAARYRWLMANCGNALEPARNRTSLYIPNYCPPSIDYVDVSKHIDEAMQCK